MASIVRTLTPQETLVGPAMPSGAAARYLNAGGTWERFRLDGLEVDEAAHALRLVALPGQAIAVTPMLDAAGGLGGLAGVAIDGEGNLYVADAANHRILRVDACDGDATPLECLRGPGSEPGELDTPRGLAIGPDGGLYIADSGNDRVQVVDLGAQQVRAIVGGEGVLDGPAAVAVDAAGGLYVLHAGEARIRKFRAGGRPVDSFWETMQAQELASQSPLALGMVEADEGERLLVVDGGPRRLLAYDTSGVLDAELTAALSAIGGDVTSVAINGQRLYAGDAAGTLATWTLDGRKVGEVALFDGLPIVAITFDCTGGVIVRPPGGAPALRLIEGTATSECGTFLAGPFAVGAEAVRWQRIALRANVPATARVQLFSLTSDTFDGASAAATPELPATCSSPGMGVVAAAGMTARDEWRPAPALGESFLALNEPGRYLWLAGVIRAGGGASPLIESIRLEFDHQSWIEHLPAVYQRDPAGRDLLERMLLLFEDMLDGVAGRMDELPALFDAFAALDAPAGASWLDWLAGWVDVELDERWDEEQRRDTVAKAFRAHGRRGTIESLRELIGLYAGAGVHIGVHITEPGRDASLWALGEVSTLGFDSMLAPAAADGAVVGTTATLGQSHLITEEDYGAPLFEHLAHRFCVGVYAVDVPDAGALARVRETVDREKPAHTVYDLCTIDAAMRVGFQAQIGVDTIVAGPPGDFVSGESSLLGLGTLLPHERGVHPPLLGPGISIGKGATLI